MPIPIQLGAITDRLRRFLRIRGGVRLSLDETLVPTVQVQDLTKGPYQAGVSPAAGTIVSPGTVGGQVLLYINPDAGAVIQATLENDTRFIGRSFSLTAIELKARTAGAARYRVGTVPRDIITGATLTTRKALVNVQQGNGLLIVPVILATVTAIPFVLFSTVSEWFHSQQLGDISAAAIPIPIPSSPATVIDITTALIIEETVAGALFDVNVRGFYQEQAP